jgi:hypothetical protein
VLFLKDSVWFGARNADKKLDRSAEGGKLSLFHRCPSPTEEFAMNRQAVYDTLQEFVTVFFLAAGPALGAAIAVAWLAGLVLGLIAVLTR